MNHFNPTAAVLWTGGKDSALALHEARQQGHHISCLVTFAPPPQNFLAHPIALMKLQAESLSLPHLIWPVSGPFAESYEAGLRWLKETHGVGTVITGDIAEVDGSPNWIRERCRLVSMNVLTPLWDRDRLALLEQLLAIGFEVVFSCVKTRCLPAGWVGRKLDAGAIVELRALREQNGLDLCGENGEYHTLVMDAPAFQRRLQLGAGSVCKRDELAYLEIEKVELREKP